MRPDDELKKAMSHVQYEFNHLVSSAMYLSGYLQLSISAAPHAGAVDGGWLEMFATMLRNLTLESHLTHVRNLIDFFIGPTRRRPDDIVASDFFASTSAWSPRADRDALNTLRDRIAKKNAHLTYRRIDDQAPWNPRANVELLCDLRDQFNASRPVYLIAVDVASLSQEPHRPI